MHKFKGIPHGFLAQVAPDEEGADAEAEAGGKAGHLSRGACRQSCCRLPTRRTGGSASRSFAMRQERRLAKLLFGEGYSPRTIGCWREPCLDRSE